MVGKTWDGFHGHLRLGVEVSAVQTTKADHALPVDEQTLRQMLKAARVLFWECDHCMKLTYKDMLELVYLVGPDVPVGSFRHRMRCEHCGRRRAVALSCTPRGRMLIDWEPREPRNFRA